MPNVYITCLQLEMCTDVTIQIKDFFCFFLSLVYSNFQMARKSGKLKNFEQSTESGEWEWEWECGACCHCVLLMVYWAAITTHRQCIWTYITHARAESQATKTTTITMFWCACVYVQTICGVWFNWNLNIVLWMLRLNIQPLPPSATSTSTAQTTMCNCHLCVRVPSLKWKGILPSIW